MAFKNNWTLDETVMPKDMNDIGNGLNDLVEKDKDLDNKKFDKAGGRVTGTVNADNVQVGGSNVYHTGRKPTASDVGALSTNGGHVQGVTTIMSNEAVPLKLQRSGFPNIALAFENTIEGSTKTMYLGTARGDKFRIGNNADLDSNGFNLHSDSDYIFGSDGFLQDISGQDIQSINKSGRYKGKNCINQPSGREWWYYDVEVHSNAYKKITARDVFTQNEFTRTCNNNIWSSWDMTYNTSVKPTPEEIGALNLTGGTINGRLGVTGNINTTGAYQFYGNNILRGSTNATILSSANNVGDIHLRPRGDADTTAQVIVDNDGTVKANNVQVGGNNVYHTGRKPTPEEIGALDITGGVMYGGLESSATYPMIIKAPTTYNSWARGIWYKNEDKTKNLYGIGIYGANENLNSFYIGTGDLPWINTLFKVSDADAFYKNNKIYHEGKKPTPTEIGAAPTIHSHNDRYYTEEEMDTKLNTKVDKTEGKQLSTNDYTTAEKNKLTGIASGANAYTHPSTHPATIMTQDATHRFVTDAEKNTWNGKAAGSHSHDDRYYTEAEINTKLESKVDKVAGKQLSTNDYTTTEKNKLAGIASGANAYTHPSTHPASMISQDATHRFATDAEKSKWNTAIEASKITNAGAVPSISTGTINTKGYTKLIVTYAVVNKEHDSPLYLEVNTTTGRGDAEIQVGGTLHGEIIFERIFTSSNKWSYSWQNISGYSNSVHVRAGALENTQEITSVRLHTGKSNHVLNSSILRLRYI